MRLKISFLPLPPQPHHSTITNTISKSSRTIHDHTRTLHLPFGNIQKPLSYYILSNFRLYYPTLGTYPNLGQPWKVDSAAPPTTRPATRRRRSDNVASESPSTTDDDEGDSVPLRSRGALDDNDNDNDNAEDADPTDSTESTDSADPNDNAEDAESTDNADPTDNVESTENADPTENAENDNAGNLEKNNTEDGEEADNDANTEDDDDNASAAAVIKTRVAAAVASAKVADFGAAPSVDKVAMAPEMPQTPPRKGQDIVMGSPSPKIELRGSSRTTGGIARGRAVGNHPNIADLEEISSLSATLLPTGKVKVYVSNEIHNIGSDFAVTCRIVPTN
ncbi:hypothetical protein CPC08DRAFT_769403 [Agrocybe pediades]|nr:hypothetical protein CPC08DRAFT_769403 [Agrocybe pediades]